MNLPIRFIFVIFSLCIFSSFACEVPYTSLKFSELIGIKVKGKETVIIEVEAPKSVDGWSNPQFVMG